jgi:hypothetical protein
MAINNKNKIKEETTMAKQTNKQSKSLGVSIPPFSMKTLKVEIEGITNLLMNKFSDKAREAIRTKQTKKAKKGQEARIPLLEFLYSIHYMHSVNIDALWEEMESDNVQIGDDVTKYFEGTMIGFPATGFTKSMVNAIRNISGMNMKTGIQIFRVMPEHISNLVKINYDKIFIREDIGIIPATSGATLIYRPEFTGWSATLSICIDDSNISPEQTCNLLETAGFAVGVGDWRPVKSGNNGMFRIKKGETKKEAD